MKKRYSIPKEQCVCGITELYDNAAKIMGISNIEGEGCEFEIEDGFVAKGV